MSSNWMILDGPDGYDLYLAFVDSTPVKFTLVEYNHETFELTGRTGEINIIPTVLKKQPMESELELVGEINEDFVWNGTVVAKAKQIAGNMRGGFRYKAYATSGRIVLF